MVLCAGESGIAWHAVAGPGCWELLCVLSGMCAMWSATRLELEVVR